MHKIIKVLLGTLFFCFLVSDTFAQDKEITSILKKIDDVQEDIKTLEKAVYSENNQSASTSFNNEDVLTKHLLKLAELEGQFQALTNKFEEFIFKIDKLSNRVSKMQADNQLRFKDIESGNNTNVSLQSNKNIKLPGTGEAQELGKISDEQISITEEVQKTQSIEAASSVILEETDRIESLLPKDKSPDEQYEFATSFLKVGDYETAEYALKEFVDTNKKHKLAGNAQYWYGETFRIRQLYQDAATAYLDGYQKYPKSAKAPINLLKLGVTLVQIGEKEQGCLMILGVEKEYPKANQSVIQKAKYEQKKFECAKTQG